MKNTETVKKALEDFTKGDIPSILNSLDENVTWINPDAREVPFSISTKNRNDVGGFFQKMGETIDVTRFEMNNFAEQGPTVVSWGSYDATVKSTGKKFTTPLVLVWKFNPEGKVIHWQAHTDTLAQSKAF
jgi:uncharacterized protein